MPSFWQLAVASLAVLQTASAQCFSTTSFQLQVGPGSDYAGYYVYAVFATPIYFLTLTSNPTLSSTFTFDPTTNICFGTNCLYFPPFSTVSGSSLRVIAPGADGIILPSTTVSSTGLLSMVATDSGVTLSVLKVIPSNLRVGLYRADFSDASHVNLDLMVKFVSIVCPTTSTTSSSTSSTSTSLTSSTTSSSETLSMSSSSSSSSTSSSTTSSTIASTTTTSIPSSSETLSTSSSSTSSITSSTITSTTTTPTTSASSSTTSSLSLSTSSLTTTSAFSTSTAGLWVPIGCYTDSTNKRTLSNAAGVVGAFTVESCLAVCEATGFRYAGVEYGSECYCDSDIGADSTLAAVGDCSMRCNGNTAEICGDSNRLNIYQYTGTLAQSVTSLSWDSLGCYTDSADNRALTAVSIPDSTGVSIESCKAACYSNGYSYAGAEYGRECYCGNDISKTAPASDGCNMACAANAAEICGGSNRMNLYRLTGTTSATSISQTTNLPSIFTTSTNTAPSTITPTPSTEPWIYVGCYEDNVNSRTLRRKITINDGMTIEKCKASCKAEGFSIAGLEYSGECYCDYYTQNGANLASEDGCNMACNANSAETCGGSDRLSLYSLAPAERYIWKDSGCYTDDVGSRTLLHAMSIDGAMTVEACQNACFKESYLLSGVEFGSECYCDNNIGNSGKSVLDGCDFTCNGDGDEFCGGSNRLNLYSYSPTVASAVTSMTTSTMAATSTAISTLTTTGTSSATTSAPSVCAAADDPQTDVEVLPAADPNIDLSSLYNLAPSKYATLYYAEAAPGQTVLEVVYKMLYPQVTLENSNKISSIVCSSGSIEIVVANQGAYNIVSTWPQSDFVLVTNTAGCNSATQRGVYLVTSSATDPTSFKVTLQVAAGTWTTVAETMEISYGIASISSQTSIALTPSCTASPSQTSSASSSSSTSLQVSYADLSPEDKKVVAYLTRNNVYDEDGNIVVTMPAVVATDTTTPVFSSSPDATEQAALESALQNAGLPSSDKLYNVTKSSLAGHCSNGVYVSAVTRRDMSFELMTSNPLSPRRSDTSRRYDLVRRDDDVDDKSFWDYAWDVACFDLVAEILGVFNKVAKALMELICALKDLYDSVESAYKHRDAIKCALTGCYFQLPPSTYWDYKFDGSAKYSIPAQAIASSSTATVSCVDCSLTVSEVKFEGRVQIVLSTGELEKAYMTPTMSWSSNLIMGLKSYGSSSGVWGYQFATLKFPASITVANEFTITPSMMVSLGVSWKTDSAVDFVGGGTVSVASGSMDLDFMTTTANNFKNWSPSVQYTYPIFSTASAVTWNPILRSALSIGVNIMNADYGAQPIYISSATSIGFNAALLLTEGGACSPGQLMMTSFSNVANNVKFTGRDNQLLAPSGDVAGTTQCFNVPNDKPTVPEVNSLRSVGGEFCTSYISYTPKVTVTYKVTTTTTPVTVPTTVPTTLTTLSTFHTSTTITGVYSSTINVAPTSYAYTAGTYALADQYRKKRGLEIPTQTTLARVLKTQSPQPMPTTHAAAAAAPVDKRAVATPSLITTWDSSKISLACSQIATGTTTKTYYTSTATAYSGTVFSTVYTTVLVQGASIVTTVTTSTVATAKRVTVTTAGATSKVTTASSCPLQTQVSCFSITGHGAPHIEGETLWGISGYSGLSFRNPDDSAVPIVFYLTCAGELVIITGGWLRVLADTGSDSAQFPLFASTSSSSRTQCTQNTVDKTILCGTGWFIPKPLAAVYPTWKDAATFADYTKYYAYVPYTEDTPFDQTIPNIPITLSYTEVACPCQY